MYLFKNAPCFCAETRGSIRMGKNLADRSGKGSIESGLVD
jgi:hypothetical protein